MSLTPAFDDAFNAALDGVALEITTTTSEIVTNTAVYYRKFIYHGYTDDGAGTSAGKLFRERLASYDATTHYARLACTKRASNECLLQHQGHCKYECVISVHERADK